MPQPPDYDDISEFYKRAAIGFEDTLELDRDSNRRYTGDWITIATLFHLHPRGYACIPDGTFQTEEHFRYKYREGLLSLNYHDLTTVRFYSKQSIEATKKWDSVAEHALQIETDQRPQVALYGMDETFWQTVGAFELANQGYIVFPEALSRRWGGPGVPDLTCFQLGEFQEILADIGIIPGGATLPEIELRTAYEQYSPTSITADKMVGVTEAKDANRQSRGQRELAEYRGDKQTPPYLAANDIQKGWLIAPKALDEIHPDDSNIGGVTWEKGETHYIDSPKWSVNEEEQKASIQGAKRMILDIVLRRQTLSKPLNSVIDDCMNDPEMLYEFVD